MSLHADALGVLTAWTPPSVAQQRLRAAYVAHLRGHDDALSRDCHPDHLTASALVVHPDGRVLLTLHARLRRWLQTGGHCEDDATLAGAALREASEESGMPDLAVDPVPVLLSRHEVPCGPLRPAHHLDVQYVAVAPRGAVPKVSDESLDVAWFAADALPDSCDDSVRALMAAALDRLADSGQTLLAGSGPEPPSGSSSQVSPVAADTPSR